MIIGIVGWMGAGKDTVADQLIENNYKRMSFAGPLKDAVAAVFGWDREMLEGATKESRQWREKIDQWWAERLGIPELTPRWVLQQWGTEVCRSSFHDDIWIASLENKLRSHTDDIVISDCRFPNEIAAVKNAGGQIWWVQRGPLPEWYPTAVMANSGNEAAYYKMTQVGIHASEWAWVKGGIDKIINNNGTLADLTEHVNLLLAKDQPLSHAEQIATLT